MAYNFTKQNQAIEYGRVDALMFNQITEDAKIVQDTINKLSRNENKSQHLNRSHVESLTFDTYNALYKYNPQDSGQGDQLTQEIIKRLRADDQYQELRNYTVGNDLSSVLGTCGLTDSVITSLPQDVKDDTNDAREAQDKADEAQGDVEAHEASDTPGEPDEGIDAEEYAELVEFAKNAQQTADKANQKLGETLKSNGQTIAKAVAGAVTKASGKASAMTAACNAFGMTNGAISGGLSIEEKFKIAQAIENQGKKFTKIIDLIGRMQQSAEKKHAESNNGGGEIVDLSEGGDIALILDEEIAMMNHPTFGVLKKAQLVDEALMQFEVETKEPECKGDIIALVDESGSMNGQRDAEAKAIVLALAHIALKQKRKLHVMFFQTSITAEYTVDGTASAIDVAMQSIGAIANRGTGGGTNFDEPMRQAIKKSRTMTKADLLVITDGHASITKQTLDQVTEAKEQDGLNIYTMLIGSASIHQNAVTEFSDRVWTCDSLLDSAASEVFEAII